MDRHLVLTQDLDRTQDWAPLSITHLARSQRQQGRQEPLGSFPSHTLCLYQRHQLLPWVPVRAQRTGLGHSWQTCLPLLSAHHQKFDAMTSE